MGFTKLDSGLLRSSIMAASLETFKVWITLLAACDENGIAEVSPIFLESICRIPIEKVEESLVILESPDKHSRSENDDGRRIERVDGGFRILNYPKYRIKSYSKSKEAIRKREWRERKGGGCPKNPPVKQDGLGHVPNVPDGSASASASASVKEKGFDQWWSLYPRKLAKQDAVKAYAAALKAGATHEDLLKALGGYCAELKKNKTEEQYVKYPATFLRADRWKDYLDRPVTQEAGAHPPASARDKEIARKLGEYIKQLWQEAKPELDVARGRGRKAYDEACEKKEREIAVKSAEYSRKLQTEKGEES